VLQFQKQRPRLRTQLILLQVYCVKKQVKQVLQDTGRRAALTCLLVTLLRPLSSLCLSEPTLKYDNLHPLRQLGVCWTETLPAEVRERERLDTQRRNNKEHVLHQRLLITVCIHLDVHTSANINHRITGTFQFIGRQS
jgi:hypothetical protein